MKQKSIKGTAMVEYAVLLAFIVVVSTLFIDDSSLHNAITGVFAKINSTFQDRPAAIETKDLIEKNKDKIYAQIGNFAWWTSSQIGGDEYGLPMTVAVGLEGTQLIALKPNTSYRITLDPLTDEELLLFGGYNGAGGFINGGLEPVVYADAAANGTGHTKGQLYSSSIQARLLLQMIPRLILVLMLLNDFSTQINQIIVILNSSSAFPIQLRYKMLLKASCMSKKLNDNLYSLTAKNNEKSCIYQFGSLLALIIQVISYTDIYSFFYFRLSIFYYSTFKNTKLEKNLHANSFF